MVCHSGFHSFWKRLKCLFRHIGAFTIADVEGDFSQPHDVFHAAIALGTDDKIIFSVEEFRAIFQIRLRGKVIFLIQSEAIYIPFIFPFSYQKSGLPILHTGSHQN